MQLDIPWSASTVLVSIIDTSMQMLNLPATFGPPIPTFETFAFGAWSFLIEHNDEKLLFDLGFPSEWDTDLPPRTIDQVRAMHAAGIVLQAPHYVSEILESAGIPLDAIDAVIWSHTHLDHMGRPSLFPPSTDLIVGEGTMENFGFGYPESPDSPYLSRELANRTVTEISFTNTTRIGGLAAYDYFGDGSFFIIEAPGHEIGHINALARVTSDPPSFIYMGGDSVSTLVTPSRRSHQV
jgi:glyoxylase-like metal-dependent hydrolase (beta-lactamase superfamily II)